LLNSLFKVRLSEEAKQDLKEIVLYLNDFSALIASKYYKMIKQKLKELRELPTWYSFARPERLKEQGVRWTFVRNYIIFFTVDEAKKEVRVRRILYAKRNFDDLV